ncbi:MAG: EamA family transporter [Caldilineaceae bacterium]
MSLSAVVLVLLSAVIHATWNLVVRARGVSQTFIRIPVIIAIVGLVPALWLEFYHTPFPAPVWGLLMVSSIFQGIHHFGLTMGYQRGDFTLVYPIVRALPVLFLALFDLARGRNPSLPAWLGMTLVALGCLVIPHTSLRTLRWTVYTSAILLWVLMAALGTVGYSIMDKFAAESLPSDATMAARYFVLEMTCSTFTLASLLTLAGQPTGLRPWYKGWKWPMLAAMGVFTSYWLILWVYQINAHASYVVAMRQFSIVIGTIAGTLLFREPAPTLRITASVLIAVGVICIALGG